MHVVRKIFTDPINVYLFIWVLILCPKISDGQCKIVAGSNEVCRGSSLNFVTSISAARYEWHSGSGLTDAHQKVTFLYDKKGYYWVSLYAFDSKNSLLCKDSVKIRVFDLPVASFSVPDTIYLCPGASYCFKNNSKMGSDNSPVTQYFWLFGDGDMSYLEDPCHFYSTSGSYLLYLNVRDSNRCEANLSKKIVVIIRTDIAASFTIDTLSKPSCPQTRAFFINLTNINKKQVKFFSWDFGDGTYDTNHLWDSFYHIYKITGTFDVKLSIIDIYGCIHSIKKYGVISNLNKKFWFDAVVTPKSQCFSDNSVYFSQKYDSTIDNLTWDFGDDTTHYIYKRFIGWDGYHDYYLPGKYDINIRADKYPCPRWDTTLCYKVIIKGPKARINVEKLENDSINNVKIALDTFIAYSDSCYNPLAKPIKYDDIVKVPRFIKKTVNTYCNATISSKIITVNKCRNDTTVILKPSGSYFVYDSFNIVPKIFIPGDPIPLHKNYPPSGKKVASNMHDTDLYSCKVPNYVKFTNNSIKYRGYPAIDNFPPYYDGTPGSDSCKNHAYPWASDSLNYEWDFDDPFALNCTSTVAKPNMECAWSTEKVPWHVYKKYGCHSVTLKVTDPVTGCASVDDVTIKNVGIDPAWDRSAYKYLNYTIQQWKTPFLPRRGLMLEGEQCIGAPQKVNLKEILPACGPQDWWINFDSAANCHNCLGTYIMDTNNDKIPDTIHYSFPNCRNWISKGTYNTDYLPHGGYPYYTPGCKTVGLRIQHGDCISTFWYHNYKYINPLPNPNFQLAGSSPCLKVIPPLTSSVPDQDFITSFRFTVAEGSKIVWQDQCKHIKDTAFKYCEKDSFRYDTTGKKIYYQCFYDPIPRCSDDPPDQISHDSLLKYYVIRDTVYFLDIHDTFYPKIQVKPNQTYTINSTIVDFFGCNDNDYMTILKRYFLGLTSPDTIICKGDSALIYSGIYVPSNYPRYKVQVDFDGDGKYDTTLRMPFSHLVDTDLFSNNQKVMVFFDTMYHRYDQAGNFTVNLRLIDTFCKDTLLLVKPGYITVSGVRALFDTLNSPWDCAPQVVQFIDSSYLLTKYRYYYDSSGKVADSVPVDEINFWRWNFGDGKGIYSFSNKQNPAHLFSMNGKFDVSLFVKTSIGCSDNILMKDYIIIPGPEPRFILLDTAGCMPFKTRVIDSSDKVSNWIWTEGNGMQYSGNFKKGDTVEWTYTTPGIFYVRLIGSDSVYNYFLKAWHKCNSRYPDSLTSEWFRYKVTVYPYDQLDFTGDTIVCSGDLAHFKDQSENTFDSIFWNFGDASFDTSDVKGSTSHRYYLDGDTISKTFQVGHTGSGARCPLNSHPLNITVKKTIADAVWDSIATDTPLFCFKNFSKGGYYYNWEFQDGDPGAVYILDTSEQCINFMDFRGVKKICLTVTNKIGCKSKDCLEIDNEYTPYIFVPNVFTPGASIGVNDTFTISSRYIEKYHLYIYNRWGQLVFESEDCHKHWDGTDCKTHRPSSESTYYYILYYKFKYIEQQYIRSGTATIIR